MFCPQCGQQQVSDALRFCSRCGLPLEGALVLLQHGGMLPRYESSGERKASRRRKGVMQGVLIFLLGILVVPILGVFTSFAPGRLSNMFEFFTIVAALLLFVGGPLRILYAALFEEGAPAPQFGPPASYGPPAITPPAARLSALPQGTVNPTTGWRARPDTAEIVQPPSVTDNTTRLLENRKSESESN
jgi:cytochrome c biogenesis protein CcdA